MKKILLISLFLGAINLFAQQHDSTLVQSLESLHTKVNQQQNDIQKLYSELNKEYRTYRIVKEDLNKKIIDKQEEVIDSLNSLIDNSNQKLTAINNQLETKIKETGQKAESQIAQLDSSVEKNRLYWIIATLVTLILGGLVYWLLGKRIKLSKTDVETQIRNTKASLEEESITINTKLIEVLDKQLKLQELKQAESPKDEEKDHSLVLKVADEATKILMSLDVMDKNIKGYKFLKKYASTILNNVNAYGYEIPPLIGQNYNSGMNMVATMEFDDSIEEGKQIIKRIIKPQINYNGKMIQAAKVIVAFNE